MVIHGVSLNGVGINGTTTGIQFNSGNTLNIRDCVIRNFALNGIRIETISSSQLYVSNTLISDNGTNGIAIDPAGSGTTNGVLNHVELENNKLDGLLVSSATQFINLTVSDSVSANNGSSGISTSSFGEALVNTMVRNFHNRQ